MSWNLFVQRELPSQWVANVGYVGTEYVRQPATVTPYNSAPFPSASTPCMANGQYNPSTGLKGGCSFQDNTIINQQWCAGGTKPGLLQHRRHQPQRAALPLVLQRPPVAAYAQRRQEALPLGWSTRSRGPSISRTTARALVPAAQPSTIPPIGSSTVAWLAMTSNTTCRCITVYSLPFGYGQRYANHGALAWIIGGFQFNGQFGHTSGTPFSVNANTNTIGNLAPGWGSQPMQSWPSLTINSAVIIAVQLADPL